MRKIKVLDELTIQKIAAGEIIERPASVVKELVENSIDANASSIIVEIAKGGKELIRVTDNGDGINHNDLNVAFKRHSTSKLRNIEDIYSINSMGFRGEALSSISSISKMEVLTKVRGSSSGLQAFVEGGSAVSIRPIGCPIGTTMIVRDLFYSLPVRRNFLKSDNIEANHIIDIVNKLALGNPDVSFRLIRDNKTILKTTKTTKLIDLVHNILGKDYSKNLIPICYEDESIKLQGLFSNNNLYRATRAHQYIFVNKRYVVDNQISRLIENQYRTLIPIGRYPIFILNIDISPSEIDINIHPTKQEIAFSKSGNIYEAIEETLRKNKNRILNVPDFILDKTENVNSIKQLPKIFNQGYDKTDNLVIHDFTKEEYEYKGLDDTETSYSPTADLNTKIEIDYFSNSNQDTNYLLYKEEYDKIKPIGRIFNTYIIAEIASEDKLIFIDQHAAHERVMYERYKKEYESETIVSQILLIPEIVELTQADMDIFVENIALFNKLGFVIEEFGPNSIAIRSVPLIFGQPQIGLFFMDLLDAASGSIKSNYDMKLDKIMKIACSKAIKGGDKINNEEILALYDDLMDCDTPLTCPHGRPTIIELTKTDLEKQFLRIF